MQEAMEALPGFTFGCDPELFIMNRDGEFVSAEGLIPGTKDDPYEVPGGAVQVDGMAAEFNINPVTDFVSFDMNIRHVLQKLQGFLPRGLKLVPVSSVTFSEKVWNETPDKAKMLGCSPDFNAWTGEVNPPPHCPENPRLRTAAGHLHIGWTNDASPGDLTHIANCRDLVKQLDWYLGGWSVKQDEDPTRRILYGKAGACRFKPYGVEYRVLSNFWLTSKVRRLNVWNRMQKAIWEMRTDYLPEKYASFNGKLVETINGSTADPEFVKTFRFPLLSIK